MASRNIQEQAACIFTLWKPALFTLREQQFHATGSAVFSSLLAFFGLHLALRSLWWCENAPPGQKLGSRYLDVYMPTAEPWECMYSPISDQASWVLVYGGRFSLATQFFADLVRPQVRTALQNLCKAEASEAQDNLLTGRGPAANEILISGAREFFYRWGVYHGAEKPLSLPFLHCDRLIAVWPAWWQSVQPLAGILHSPDPDTVNAVQEADTAGIQMQFSVLAAAIWRLAQEEGLLTSNAEPVGFWRGLFRFQRQPQVFKGLLLLQGNHHNLWEVIRKDCAE